MDLVSGQVAVLDLVSLDLKAEAAVKGKSEISLWTRSCMFKR